MTSRSGEDLIASMMTTPKKKSRISTNKLLETGILPRHQQLAECSGTISRAQEGQAEKIANFDEQSAANANGSA
jgi:hypothetical protein